MPEPQDRRLVAVMFCDMVGFTAAMQEDEQAALADRDRYRTVIEERHDEFGGEIVQYYGDGTLSIFGNTVDAVRCAVAIQQTLGVGPVVPVRVGLHVGDVVVEDHGLLGDAVNVASRVESFGVPGAVLVSDSVHDLVKNQPDITLVSLGEFHLDNVARPHELFAVDDDGLVIPDAATLGGKGERLIQTPSTNLPRQPTSFIGRDREIDEIMHLLTPARLVTLTGTGGTGKTRLALRLAALLADSFPDGIWLAELAPITDPAMVPGQVSEPFGVRAMKTDRPLTDVLTDYLADRRLLLLLDNCEHVIEASSELAQTLLARCPHLKIMATSRELLAIPEEVVYRVPPMGTTDTATEDAEAVRLFADRARQVQADFRLNADNLPAVQAITSRLGGLPLAIELAASRANMLTPGQMLERLDQRFDLITSARRAEGRHATLKTALDWSHDLLSVDQQALFRQLAAFTGGWTLEAAEAVCSVPGADPLDLLGRLVDQSLVEVSAAAGVNRYRYLEPVRQYARAKLQTSGEEPTARLRHARLFADLAERADRELKGADQVDWVRRVEADHDNYRAAISWSIEAGEDELALRLGSGLAWFWWVRGYWAEARDWFGKIYAATAAADPVLRGRLVYNLAGLEVQRARPAEVKPLFEEHLPVLAELGTEIDLAWISVRLGDSSDAESGRRLSKDAHKRFTAEGDAWGEAYALWGVGWSQWIADEPQGFTVMRGAVDSLVGLGDRWTAGWFAFNLGFNLAFEGRYDEGRQVIEQALELVANTDDRWIAAHCRHRLGVIATMTGDLDEALALFNEALPVHRRIGDENCTATAQVYLGEVLADLGRFDDAQRNLIAALRGARELQNPHIAAAALRRVAWMEHQRQNHERAADALGAAQTVHAEIGRKAMSLHDSRRTEEVALSLSRILGDDHLESRLSASADWTLEEAIDFAFRG